MKNELSINPIETLRAQLVEANKLAAAISRDCNQVANERNDLHNQLVAAKAENEALRADAKRYRWLRHGDNDELLIVLVPDDGDRNAYAYMLHNEKLDAAIDAAVGETR